MANITFTAASVQAGTNAQVEIGVAGATIAAGNAVYKDATDSNSLKPCDADVLASAACVGIALNGASDGQNVKYQTAGYLTVDAVLTAGIPYFVSTTAGGVMLIGDLGSGDYTTAVGIAVSTTSLKLGINVSGVAQ